MALPPPFIRTAPDGQIVVGPGLVASSGTGAPTSGLAAAAFNIQAGFPSPPAACWVNFNALNGIVTCGLEITLLAFDPIPSSALITLPVPRSTPFVAGAGQLAGTAVANSTASAGTLSAQAGTVDQALLVFALPTATSPTAVQGTFQYALG